MTNRTQIAGFLLVLAGGLAGCNGDVPSPTAPSPPIQRTVIPPGSSYGGNGDYVRVGVTLFGVVFETTAAGRVPIADAEVYCDACGESGHTALRTDANGYYSFNGDLASGGGIWMATPSTTLFFGKEGYDDPPGLSPTPGLPAGRGWRSVPINGDTRFDVQLIRK
jgi:hypothetical protein